MIGSSQAEKGALSSDIVPSERFGRLEDGTFSMLQSLYIKNYVLIDEIRVEFRSGLSIITGETGAGKSILIGALGAVLGDKLTKDVIRSGADKSIIEAEFALDRCPAIRSYLQAHEVEIEEDFLIIRREVSQNGKSRCYINDQPVPVNVLAEIGDLLVDLHGQHAHQLLLQVPYHGEYLDEYAGLTSPLAQLKEAFHRFSNSLKELEQLQEKAQEAQRSREFMQFQLNEIAAVAPQLDEEEALKAEENILRNSELLAEKTSQLFQKLYEADESVSEILTAAEADLQQLAQIDARFSPMVSDCQNARIVVTELAQTLNHYSRSISFDPERLEKIRNRLAALAVLKKKYGGTIESVLALQAKLRAELDLVDHLQERIDTLRKEIEENRLKVAELSQQISQQRRRAGEVLAADIEAVLNDLGMARARFQIRQQVVTTHHEPFILLDGEMVRVGPRGYDQIEFLLAANPGEDFKPLTVVASGGEISRVMLALKSLLAETDRVPVLIFDEIDIGISGRIAQAVGRRLRLLAKSHQVICITHLPQIASMADHHFLVEKSGDEKQTKTAIRILNREERIQQVAALLGGERVTETHLRSAEELIEQALI